MAATTPSADFELESLSFDDLDITSQEVSFDEIDSLMSKFQEDERVRDALEQGVDMREYTKKISHDLSVAERVSMKDYIEQANNLAKLYHQIQTCDGILGTMENLLSGFQADLGNIGDEIRHLQEQSSDMSVKLRNRKAVADQLGEFLGDVVVSRSLASNICEAEVNDVYAEYLMELHKKIAFVKKEENARVRACQTMGPELDKLRLKAVSKIREFLLQEIHALRKPNTNIQILQQNKLIKYKYLNRFLCKYAPDYGVEVRSEYQDTLARIYFAYCKEYIYGLMKLHSEIGSKNDLLGVEESSLKSFFTSKYAKTRSNVFSLGERHEILSDLEAPYIVLHDAQRSNSTYSYEVLFRSLNQYFKDAVTAEHMFNQDFFGKIDLFGHIFGKCASLVLDNVTSVTSSSFDAIGLLIVIRIAQRSYDVLKEKNIACLFPFYDRLLQTVWPRFELLCNMHVESLRTADPERLGSVELRPHYITRRVAELSAALLCLNEEFGDARVVKLVATIHAQHDTLLRGLARKHRTPFERVVFLINNYDHILSVCEPVKQAMENRIATFVELELDKYYKRLIAFVKEYGPIVSASSAPESERIDAGTVESLVQEFSASWKDVIDSINKDALTYFSNFLTGSQILQQVLTQLVLHYTRFEEIIRKCFRASVFKDFVPTARVTYHIKKSSMCF